MRDELTRQLDAAHSAVLSRANDYARSRSRREVAEFERGKAMDQEREDLGALESAVATLRNLALRTSSAADGEKT